jgi:multiple sugar transport system permease protein
MIFPLFWMIILSLKKYPKTFSDLNYLLFSEYSIQNYVDTLQTDNFGLYFLNSILVVLIVTVGNVLFCYTVAYALSRRNFKYQNLILISILSILTIPPHVIMIPLYDMMVVFGWINTYFALTIPWLITPFGIFLVYQYLKSIPFEIEEAAKIDGAGDFRIIYFLIMPIAKPILSVLFLFTLLSNWNSFLFPFLLTNDEAHRTLPVGLAFYLGKQSIDWGHLMAGASIAALPVLILYLIFQKEIIKSLTAGALKD